jgi:phosphatidylglycerophosphate synthase
MKQATKDGTFQWSFIGVILLALLLIVLAVVGVVPLWIIAIAIIGGIAGDVLLLYFWGKDYMSRY